MDYRECLKKGLIRRTVPSRDKALQSLETADKWLEEAHTSALVEARRSSLLCSYLAVFHAARAVLFRDGYREKSHACIALFLKANYVNKLRLESEWVELLDHLRETRHSDQYSFNFVASPDEVEAALDNSAAFVSRMKELVAKRKKDQVSRSGKFS